jgi:hypothetical protein
MPAWMIADSVLSGITHVTLLGQTPKQEATRGDSVLWLESLHSLEDIRRAIGVKGNCL